MGAEPFRSLKNLYYGEKAAEKKEEIARSIRAGKPLPGLYLILFASNGVDQLDIIPSYFALRKHITERRPVLAGICFGRQEAFETVERMAADAFRVTGACRLQSFLLDREERSAPA